MLPEVYVEENTVEDEKNNINFNNNQENEEKGTEEKKTEEKKVDINIIKESFDSLDLDLKEFLMQFYLRKKVPVLPFNRLSSGLYEYGTQKVVIKKENNTLKGQLYNYF